jgi:hypothetical protein
MTVVMSRKMKARGVISWAVLGMMFLLPPTPTSAQSTDQNITFARDILPILQENSLRLLARNSSRTTTEAELEV